MHLRVVTYNIHKCRGLDRRVRPARIVEVLREIDADIIALQEVLSLRGGAREKDQAGYIAEQMAKGGAEPAGTAGSQFFVVTAPDAGLPADYAVLGKVVRGMDVVKRIEAQAPPDTPQQGGPPKDPVVMQTVSVTEE